MFQTLYEPGFCREIEPVGCIYREIYFKDWAHVIVEAAKSKIFRLGPQAENPEKSDSPKAAFWQKFLFLKGDQSFSY